MTASFECPADPVNATAMNKGIAEGSVLGVARAAFRKFPQFRFRRQKETSPCPDGGEGLYVGEAVVQPVHCPSEKVQCRVASRKPRQFTKREEGQDVFQYNREYSQQ